MSFIRKHAKTIKWVTYAFLIFFTFIFQTTFGVSIRIFDRIPNMLLGLILCISVFEGTVPGMLVGALSGLFVDICDSDYIGFNMLFLCLICCALGYFSKEYMKRSIWSTLSVVAVCSVLYNAIYFFFNTFIFYSSSAEAGWLTVLLEALLTTVFSVGSYFVVGFLYDKFREDERETD